MKLFAKIETILLVLFVGFATEALVGCVEGVRGERIAISSSTASSMPGEWRGRFLVVGNITGTTFVDNPVTYVFRNDGTGTVEIPCCGETFTWKIENGNLILNAGARGDRVVTLSRNEQGLNLYASWSAMSLDGQYPQTHSIRMTKVRR